MAGGESSTGSGGSFRSRLEYFLYSGDKKHVFAGIAIISVIFGAPWFFMNRGRLILEMLPSIAARCLAVVYMEVIWFLGVEDINAVSCSWTPRNVV